jgi:hypothetical protein
MRILRMVVLRVLGFGSLGVNAACSHDQVLVIRAIDFSEVVRRYRHRGGCRLVIALRGGLGPS